MFTLEVVCPHCSRVTPIAEWPHDDCAPILFRCLPNRGGCGGYSAVQPPDIRQFPNLEVAIVPGDPLPEHLEHWLKPRDSSVVL